MIFGVAVLGKNVGGANFTFVYLIVLLTLMSGLGNLVNDAAFICEGLYGPKQNVTNSAGVSTVENMYPYWLFWHEYFDL
jgi:hypothetical protein